jgi:hypothetical protein
MAEILDGFNFNKNKGKKPLYPWAEWTDGQIRQIKQGEDFHCKAQSMSVQIYNKAREKGLTAHVSIINKQEDFDGDIVFQLERADA